MKRPLKVAAYSGLFLILLMLVFNIISFALINSPSVLTPLSMIYSFVIAILSIFFIYGFIVLGRKFNSRLLVVMAWIGVILAVIFLMLTLVGNIFMNVPDASAQEDSDLKFKDFFKNLETLGNQSDEDFLNLDPESQEFFMKLFIYMVLLYLIISIILGVYSILFGIGLLKIKDKVEYAKAAGILNIIAGATYFIFIGFLIQIAAFIVEIIMFFEASKKFEKKKR